MEIAERKLSPHQLKMARKREARRAPVADGLRTSHMLNAFLSWVIEPNEQKNIKGVPLWRFIAWNKGRKYSGADIREANKWNGVGRPIPKQPQAFKVAA